MSNLFSTIKKNNFKIATKSEKMQKHFWDREHGIKPADLKPLPNIINNHYLMYTTPINLNYNWSFGSLVGLFFALQIVTGILLSMWYTADTSLAFKSVDFIMQHLQTGCGYIFRYSHANGASMIFILLYLHIGRAFYYNSFAYKRYVWYSGVIIFLLMMGTAFIGYVLPWGQMSFWGATVITSLITILPTVGKPIVEWIWGDYAVENATLIRFFSLHYLLPFITTGVILLHLTFLHLEGSTNPTGSDISHGKITFHPYFTYKDAFIFMVTLTIFFILVFLYPNFLGHTDNFIQANRKVTPKHIVPEWYFTPFYAILRSCPLKAGGIIGMFLAIVIWLALPSLYHYKWFSHACDTPYLNLHKFFFWIFIGDFMTLFVIGSNPAEDPFVKHSKIAATLYFLLMVITFFVTQRFDNEFAKNYREIWKKKYDQYLAQESERIEKIINSWKNLT